MKYWLQDSMYNSFVSAETPSGVSYSTIESVDDWWDWTENVLVPTVLTRREPHPNDPENSTAYFHVTGFSNMIIGGVRLSQERAVRGAGKYCYESTFNQIMVLTSLTRIMS